MITIKNAVKKYGEGANTVYALNGVNFETKDGEVCVIIGASGSGKSTLLNIIGGIDKLDEGTIVVDGEKLNDYSQDKFTLYRRKKTGFIFQFYNLIQDLTVEENIKIAADIADETLDIEDLMKTLDITSLRDRFPKELSGGQQQRVSIARALIKKPSLLLCDELTGALDSKSSKEVLKCIEKVNQKYKTTILIITHNDAICALADHVVQLKDGKIIRDETNQKISVDLIEL